MQLLAGRTCGLTDIIHHWIAMPSNCPAVLVSENSGRHPTAYFATLVTALFELHATNEGGSQLQNSAMKPLRVTLRSMNVPPTTTNSNGFAIRAERVSRHYQMGETQIRAVNEISLQVGAGEFL